MPSLVRRAAGGVTSAVPSESNLGVGLSFYRRGFMDTPKILARMDTDLGFCILNEGKILNLVKRCKSCFYGVGGGDWHI